MPDYIDHHGRSHAFGYTAAQREVRSDDRNYVFHSWSAQGSIDPLPIAKAEGVRFWDYDGREYLDFSSQLVNLNLGHQHPELVQAIQDQAGRLATIQPGFANDVRGELAKRIVEHSFDGARSVFFTNGGADSNENAVRMARHHTGRHKILARHRSYHGSTGTAISLSGDPRRWATGTLDSGVVHFFGPYLYRSEFHAESPEQESQRALEHLEHTIQMEGAQTIAAIILESVTGSNGLLPPPPGYLAGVRELCTRYGIVMICDEVMAGFGRTGEWFGFQGYGVTPDLVTFAKGVNSGYVPLGGVIVSDAVHTTFIDRKFPGGLTYSGHPLAAASGLASFNIMKRNRIPERARDLGQRIVGPRLREMAARHPSVGDVRGLGLFWCLELVVDRETRQPLVPHDPAPGDAARFEQVVAACKDEGLWPFAFGNRLHVTPPLIISEGELTAGLDILDRALEVADRFCTGA